MPALTQQGVPLRPPQHNAAQDGQTGQPLQHRPQHVVVLAVVLLLKQVQQHLMFVLETIIKNLHHQYILYPVKFSQSAELTIQLPLIS